MDTCFSVFSGRCLSAVSLLCFSMSPNAAQVSWPGQVVDARTAAPVPGIECFGGGRGRVDLTPKAVSDADGNYVVTYEDALDLGFWEFYALDASDPQARYFHYRRSQVPPQPLLVRLVPVRAFIQGTVADAVTGQPLADVPVSLGRPGRYVETVSTNPNGTYSFHQPAYDGQTNQETIPEGERAEEGGAPTVPITDYWLRVDLAGYRPMDTAARNLVLSLQSSLTDAIHTRVDLALAPEAAPAGVEDATATLVTPPGWRLTSSTLLNGEVGQPLSYQVSANTQPTSFAATGLPAGLALDPATGLISGNPETPGLFTVEVSAVGPEGTATQRLTLVVRMTDDVVFDNGNIAGVQSGPPEPTTFTLATPTRITYVNDYHYFNGGVLPGTIALRHEDGTTYGPWQAAGRIGQGGVQNAYWEVWPVVVLKSGTYTVVDSHPATWSHNSQSGNCGFTSLRGSTTTLDTPEVLAAWAANHDLTGDDATATADPDADNQPNWAELATGGNPALPDAVPGLAISVAGGQLTVNVPLCAGGVGVPGGDFVVNGARVIIEVTSSLGTEAWQPGIALLDLANAVRNNRGDGREVLALPVQASRLTPGPWFIRERLVRVELPRQSHRRTGGVRRRRRY